MAIKSLSGRQVVSTRSVTDGAIAVHSRFLEESLTTMSASVTLKIDLSQMVWLKRH